MFNFVYLNKLKLSHKILLTLKILIFLLMSWLIVNRLFLQQDFKEQFNFFKQNIGAGNAYLFVLAILLMPVNWGLETYKWKVLLRSNASGIQLVQSIVAGITAGFVTPGRTGEFIGRVLFLNDGDNSKVFYLSFIGGTAQTAASLVIAIPFIYLWKQNAFIVEAITGCATVYLLFYFRFDLVNRWLSSSSILQRYSLLIKHEDLPAVKTQVFVLLLSMLRFTVYLLQYVLLLSFFGIGPECLPLFTHSVVYLLAQSFSPLMPLLDVSYRGATALYVFKDISSNTIAILTAVMVVWIVNLVIPALVGYLFILRKKPNQRFF